MRFTIRKDLRASRRSRRFHALINHVHADKAAKPITPTIPINGTPLPSAPAPKGGAA
jgi:hypothetical protein